MKKNSPSPRFFGTDGIRSEAFGSILNNNFAKKLGASISQVLSNNQLTKKILIARDSRTSGEALEQAFIEGLSHHPSTLVYKADISPTPCLSYGTGHIGADLGVMITASHNPKKDNGFKFFHPNGKKITPQEELDIEALLENEMPISSHKIEIETVDLFKPYSELILQHFPPQSFNGIKVVLDTAHGATCNTSSTILTHMGVDLIHIAKEPDGHRINEGVGSEYPSLLAEHVLAHKADLGFAHDGDGDRLVCVDHRGEVIPGEILIGLFAEFLFAVYPDHPKIIATTLQSNTGLDAFIRQLGGQTLRTLVGDRHVSEALSTNNGLFGGESSGHFIFPKIHPSGDGLLAALHLLKILKTTSTSLNELKQRVTLYPQLTYNLKVTEKKPLEGFPEINLTIKAIEKSLAPNGRLLIRYSGTEPLLRILLEGPSLPILEAHLESLKAALSFLEAQ